LPVVSHKNKKLVHFIFMPTYEKHFSKDGSAPPLKPEAIKWLTTFGKSRLNVIVTWTAVSTFFSSHSGMFLPDKGA